MPITIPFEIRIDPEVQTDIVLANPTDIDILDIGSRGLPLCCPLCRHVGPFSRDLTKYSKFYVTRGYQCPVCLGTITLTIRIRSLPPRYRRRKQAI